MLHSISFLWFWVCCEGFKSLLVRVWTSSGNCNLSALQHMQLEIKQWRQIIKQDQIWQGNATFTWETVFKNVLVWIPKVLFTFVSV